MRTEQEIRDEIAKWRSIRDEHKKAKRYVDAAYAALTVATLSWTLAENKSPAHWKKE